jgi:cyanophycinase-like exopeptidase
MAELHRELLAATGYPRPRAVILAVSGPAPEDRAAQEAEAAVRQLASLAAEVEPVVIPSDALDADDAAIQAIGEADLVCLVNSPRGRLCSVLSRTRLGAALCEVHERGAVLVGSAGGAEVLAAHHAHVRGHLLPWPVAWRAALGILPGAVILPDYDRVPEALVAAVALQVPHGTSVLGIDGAAALVGRDGSWQVHGPARVTVWQGRHRRRYRQGDVFRI